MEEEIAENEVDAGSEGEGTGESGSESAEGSAAAVETVDETPEEGGEAQDPGEGGAEVTEDAGEEGGEAGAEAENPWNGEVSALHKHDWYTNLDTAAQKALESGLDRIRKGMDRAFHSRMQEISADRDALREREQILIDIFEGNKSFDGTLDDLVEQRLEAKVTERTADLQRELEEARAGGANKAELDRIRGELEAAQAAKADLEGRVAELEPTVKAFYDMAESAREATLEQMVEETESFLKEHAPDVLDNEDALNYFTSLPDSWTDREGNETALRMLRVKFPEPERDDPVPDPPEDVPDGVDLMGSGGGKDAADGGSHSGGWSFIDQEIQREKRRMGQ